MIEGSGHVRKMELWIFGQMAKMGYGSAAKQRGLGIFEQILSEQELQVIAPHSQQVYMESWQGAGSLRMLYNT